VEWFNVYKCNTFYNEKSPDILPDARRLGRLLPTGEVGVTMTNYKTLMDL
jgi:hypothetical protein